MKSTSRASPTRRPWPLSEPPTRWRRTDKRMKLFNSKYEFVKCKFQVVVHFTAKAEEAETKITVVLVKKSGRGLGLSVVLSSFAFASD